MLPAPGVPTRFLPLERSMLQSCVTACRIAPQMVTTHFALSPGLLPGLLVGHHVLGIIAHSPEQGYLTLTLSVECDARSTNSFSILPSAIMRAPLALGP